MTPTQTAVAEVKPHGDAVKAVHDEPGTTNAPNSDAPAPDVSCFGDGLPVEVPVASWQAFAECTKARDPNLWHGRIGSLEADAALWVCETRCPVRELCLADALAFEAGRPLERRHGIWGGTTPHERAEMDEERRPGSPGRMRLGCARPGRNAGLERHAALGEEPCPPCREYVIARAALVERDERVLALSASGLTVGQIALTVGARRDTVRAVLARPPAEQKESA